MSGSVDDLTDGQKDCLRLFFERYQAKEIAKRLGISPATVHQRLTAARKTLGVGTSMEAARLLAQAENTLIYDRVLYDGIDVAASAPTPHALGIGRLLWPLPTPRRPKNDLSASQTLIAIVGLAIAFMIAMAFYFLAIHLLSDSLHQNNFTDNAASSQAAGETYAQQPDHRGPQGRQSH